MRKVKVFKYDSKLEKVPDGSAWLLGWGMGYEELTNGVGSYSVAIIERNDGSVECVYCELIKFEMPGGQDL